MEQLLVLCGPSGSGKTAVMDELHRQYGLREAASITDRPKRTPDELGHVFLSKQEFDALAESTPLLLPTTFAGYRYAQTKAILDNNDILVLDPKGVQDIRREYRERPVLVIGITASSEVLASRMRKRGDSEESVEGRLAHDEVIFCDLYNICDEVVEGLSIKDTASAIYSLLKEEKCMSKELTPCARVKIEIEQYTGNGYLVRRVAPDDGDDRDFWLVSTDSGETMTLLPDEFEVLSAPQDVIRQLELEVSYSNGDVVYTRFNGTLDEAFQHYLGKVFNIGTASDDLQKCTKLRCVGIIF